MLELYYFPLSRCSKKVKMTLVEKEVPHKTHVINLWNYDHLKPDFLRLNPKGLVPVVVHDGKVITESDTINQYIDETFQGTKRLVPDTVEGKKQMMEWIELQDYYPTLSWRVLALKNKFVFPLNIVHELLQKNYSGKINFVKLQLNKTPESSEFHEFYQKKLLEVSNLEENLVDGEKRNELISKIETVLDKVETKLSKSKWLVDDMFSLADIVWLSILDRLDDVNMECFWINGRRPSIEQYLISLRSRPSYKKVYSRPLLIPYYLLLSYLN